MGLYRDVCQLVPERPGSDRISPLRPGLPATGPQCRTRPRITRGQRTNCALRQPISRTTASVKGRLVATNSSKTDGRFAHFMLNEIYEQPGAVRRVLKDRLDSSGQGRMPELDFTADQIRSFSKITIAASGSSRHAGMAGEFMFERMAGIQVEVDFASQYCYRDPLVGLDELTIFLSQSGTTVDTVSALKVARRKHARSLAICNVPETPLTQLADATLLTHAGKEVAIAATKSFTTQLTALFLLAAYFAQVRGTFGESGWAMLKHLNDLPAK